MYIVQKEAYRLSYQYSESKVCSYRDLNENINNKTNFSLVFRSCETNRYRIAMAQCFTLFMSSKTVSSIFIGKENCFWYRVFSTFIKFMRQIYLFHKSTSKQSFTWARRAIQTYTTNSKVIKYLFAKVNCSTLNRRFFRENGYASRAIILSYNVIGRIILATSPIAYTQFNDLHGTHRLLHKFLSMTNGDETETFSPV